VSDGSLRPVSGFILKAYKLTLSPLFMALGVRCRHEPSCSEYAAEACSRHGAWAGVWMGFARFCRCRPGGSSGYDPVPRGARNGRWYTPWRYGDWRGPQRQSADARSMAEDEPDSEK
jgi:uncharacterized protein